MRPAGIRVHHRVRIARRCPRQQQVRHIRAGEQQQHRRQRQKYGQALVQIDIHSNGRAPERVQRDLIGAAMRIGKLRDDALHLEIEFFLGLPAADPGLEPSENVEPVTAAFVNLLSPVNQRSPKVHSRTGRTSLKIRRSHSHNRDQALIEALRQERFKKRPCVN